MAMNPVRQDLTEEEVLAAQKKVLDNITKDANYYTKLYAGLKPTEKVEGYREIEIAGKNLDKNLKKEMEGRKADGYIKKELKKDAKANVKDNLGDSEKAPKKPKGVSEFKDKGVTGSIKVVKEGIEEIIREKLAQKKANEAKVEEHHNDPNFPVVKGLYDLLDAIVADWGKEDLYHDVEDVVAAYIEPDATTMSKEAIKKIKDVLENYDVLEDYAELVNNIAVKEPGSSPMMAIDRINNLDTIGEDKSKKSAVGKMKEALKTALKKEIKKDKGLEEGALDDQIAAAEKTVAQKKKRNSWCWKKSSWFKI